MPIKNQTDPKKNFVLRFLPWLLGGVMLLVYVFTLNPWVTLLNIGQVATASGWIWMPQLFGPVSYLATLPFHWLPPASIPLALNIFSAVCAALTLVLLARSVAVLPQDRTEAQRQREKSDFSFLTGWPAFFPPVLAVVLAGLQLTFWEHATNYTGEIFDLLLFAFIIWLLLEYRLDEKPWRLAAAAAAFGAGMAEDWAFVGFFPVFLAAIIWLKRVEFFNITFLTRMMLCGLGGMLFFLLLPVLAKFSGNLKMGIWEALRPNIHADWQVVRDIKDGTVRYNLALASLSTLLPVLAMAIRWKAGFGDSSRIGVTLANNMFHLVYGAIFTVCVWVMFDPPFSPQQLFGTPSLTLYYFAALGIGYNCGYFLLVFGKKALPGRRDPKPRQILPKEWLWVCPVIVATTFTAAAFAIAAMIYQNTPVIREINNDTLLKFARLTTQDLPKNGAILLCDSDAPGQNQPLRSLLIHAMLAREGRTQAFPVVDSQSLNWAAYHRYLHERYPDKWPLIVKTTDKNLVSPLVIFGLLNSLSQSNTLCYLNPSYGYYFEKFYQEPHGLVYLMKTFPDHELLPPALDKNIIAENETFWPHATETIGPTVQKALFKPERKAHENVFNWLLVHLYSTPEPNQNSIFVGMLCSRSLDDWGVQLQRAGELEKAAARFAAAKQLNPDNVVAGINLKFNQTLRAGHTNELAPEPINPDQFGKYRNWNAVLNANGPFDEISFCFAGGFNLMQDAMFHQAAQEFTRVRQLAPHNLATRVELAQIYLFNRQPDQALEVLHDPLTDQRTFGLNETNSTGPHILAAAAHFQKNEIADGTRLLETEIALNPTNDTVLMTAVQAYMLRGLYTNALHVIARKLARTPDDPQWLFGQGYANLQIGHYDDAVAALTRVLEIQTNDPTARFNRALAYLQSDRLPQAREDYRRLQSTYTNSFQVAFGLAEIGWREHDTNEAVRNYNLYLANAPTNSAEFKIVRERLAQLRGH